LKDLSLIIVNWNTKGLLLECIQSIKDETEKHTYEIIVVDNASTDGSQEAVQKRHPDVLLICNSDNLGFSKANNIGIELSTGRFVTLVNSDIKILNGCLDKMCEFMAANSDIGLLGPKTINENGRLRYNVRDIPNIWNTLCETFGLHKIFPGWTPFRGRSRNTGLGKKTMDVGVLSGCLLMAQGEALSSVGVLNERYFIYGEDKDWCKRFADAGWRVVFNPNFYSIHYGGASSAVAPVHYLVEQLKSDFIFWEIHHGRGSMFLYTLLKMAHFLIRIAAIHLALFFVRNGSKGEIYRFKLEGNKACLMWLFDNRVRGSDYSSLASRT